MSHVRFMFKKYRPVLQFIGRALAAPFVFVWVVLEVNFPILKKIWDTAPIAVINVCSCPDSLKNSHGVVYALDTGQYGVTIPNNESRIPPSLDICHEFGFRVNRPELLNKPSEATIYRLRRQIERMGYEVHHFELMQHDRLMLFTPY